MNKIALIFTVGIWLIIAPLLLIFYFTQPSEEEYEAVNDLVKTMQDYIQQTDIDPSGITNDNPDGKFVWEVANYLDKLQELEAESNRIFKLTLVIVEPQNLSSKEQINSKKSTLRIFESQIAKAAEQRVELAQKVIDEISHIQPTETIFGIYAFMESLKQETEEDRGKLIALRGEIAAYVKAIMDFVEVRDGQYKYENRRLIFDSAEDQTYYEGLQSELNIRAEKLDKFFLDKTEDMRKELRDNFSQ